MKILKFLSSHIGLTLSGVVVILLVTFFFYNFIHPMGVAYDEMGLWGVLIGFVFLNGFIAHDFGKRLYQDEKVEVLKDDTAEKYCLEDEYKKGLENLESAGNITTFGLCFFGALMIMTVIFAGLVSTSLEVISSVRGDDYELINSELMLLFMIGCVITAGGLIHRGVFLIQRRNRLKERTELWLRYFRGQSYVKKGMGLILAGVLFAIILVVGMGKFPIF